MEAKERVLTMYNLPPRSDDQKKFWTQFWAGFGSVLLLVICEFFGGPLLVVLGLVVVAINAFYLHSEKGMPLGNFFIGFGACMLMAAFDFMRRFAIGLPMGLAWAYVFWRTYLQYIVVPILADRKSTSNA